MFDLYATVPGQNDVGVLLASQLTDNSWFTQYDIWCLGRIYWASGSNLKVDLEFGCDLEFWDYSESVHKYAGVAPRENKASRFLNASQLGRSDTTIGTVSAKTLEVFEKRMLDDIDFPIDVVYTWVDGDDPEWIDARRRAEAEVSGREYHPEASHEARFRSRDELRYSLRSLEMFAPWVRNVFLVTNGQLPTWLNTKHPQLAFVRHEDIYDDLTHLPTFNSNSIISRLHHIQGLAEHYIYVNDDVFFGRYVDPIKFFFPNGIARVSVSNNRRPFGASSASDQPHINLTRNIRDLLEKECGVTVSRAIKHTPHPQLRSIHFEMEQRFNTIYQKTWASRFRHHEDIVADQLFHYYAQIIGKAIPSGIRYNYINILDDSYLGVVNSTLTRRNVDAFCINDAPVQGAKPMPEETVSSFLKSYFPIKSKFEL